MFMAISRNIYTEQINMKLIKNAIISTAIFSMVFLPVAQGIAAEKHQQLISKSEIQAAFLRTG